ncbi:two component transcriptional regulator, LuxR family [Micromonospora rhizosphaerae]|uniref:Two component transcriptional regulator, LuxR family n=1 Tax=Micromonospora rhizosphaerae TaxID=568872 RepID=A0A1C6T0M9_9ACTN|nr:response regulator transcription factor [Micromonospora rhizosphaerae]SCL34905.1 two component transcriptional regulator, LuxR family [Micromonospora rhizosphaerae]
MTNDQFDSDGLGVLIVDDIALHRDNLVTALAGHPPIGYAAGATGADDAVRLLHTRRFSVVLLSMAGVQSRGICRDIVVAADPARVVAYAVSVSDGEIMTCAEAGVSGYLLRDDPYPQMVTAVQAAARGDIWCPPPVAAVLMRRVGPRGTGLEVSTGPGRLTARERQILGLIDDGLSNKEIARRLSIEVRTVKNHVHNLLEKLRVHRRGEAAALLRSHARRAPL